jgi:hypothetical protein
MVLVLVFENSLLIFLVTEHWLRGHISIYWSMHCAAHCSVTREYFCRSKTSETLLLCITFLELLLNELIFFRQYMGNEQGKQDHITTFFTAAAVSRPLEL